MLFSPQVLASKTLARAGGGGGGPATTWNPSDKSASITLSNGNLTAADGSTGDMGVRGTTSKSSGKYYAEFTTGATYSGGDTGLGIASSSATLSSVGNTTSGCFAAFASAGTIYFNGASQGTGIGAIGAGQVVCMAIDMDNKRGWLRLNTGNWNGFVSGDPATNTSGIDISSLFTSNAAFPLWCANVNGASVTANFGGSAFTYTPPSGFSAWG